MFDRLKRILNNIKLGLAFGMKAADEQILHGGNSTNNADSSIHQEQNEHRVAHHLLKGEVTQEVQELTWRTHAVARESRNFEYFSPMKAVKDMTRLESKKPKIYNPEEYSILTVQENKAIGDGVYDALSKIDPDKVDFDDNGEVNHNIGMLPKPHNYTLKIGRSGLFTPRYLIEEYTKKLVCLTENEEENRYIVDFYVTKYPNDKEFKSKGFVREVEYVKNEGRKSDVTDIRTVEFFTSHAYRFHEGVAFKFKSLRFVSVFEYDGDYVLRFNAEAEVNAEDFFDGLYCESMAKKYETKAPKECTIAIDPYSLDEIRTYTCSMCGKTVRYNVKAIDEKRVSEKSGEGSDTTEYMDMETSEQTFGKMVCRECMDKHKAELLQEYNKRNNG